MRWSNRLRRGRPGEPSACGRVAVCRARRRALRAQGWRPTPIRELVLKVHQRCNLACDYCYVYDARRPDLARPAGRDAGRRRGGRAAVANLGRHVRRHDLPSVRLVLHGGEPLLLGPDRTRSSWRPTLRGARCRPTCTARHRRADQRRPARRGHGWTCCASTDHGRGERRRHARRTTTGTGYAQRPWQLRRRARARSTCCGKPENRAVYAGMLCTVSRTPTRSRATSSCSAFEPPIIDFLLPHANWDNPAAPAGTSRDSVRGLAHRRLRSLVRRGAPGHPGPAVRGRHHLLLGGSEPLASRSGSARPRVAVVESDGAIEQVDSLKSAYAGACATGLDVRRDELDDALDDPGIVPGRSGGPRCPTTAGRCPVVPSAAAATTRTATSRHRLPQPIGVLRRPAPADRARRVAGWPPTSRSSARDE